MKRKCQESENSNRGQVSYPKVCLFSVYFILYLSLDTCSDVENEMIGSC